MTLTIGYGNVHSGNRTPRRAIKQVRRRKPDSMGWGEAINLVDRLPNLGGYRTIVGQHDGTRAQRRSVLDAPISTRREHRPLGSLAIQASEQVSPTRIAPARTIHGSLFQKDGVGRIAHLNGHPNAAVMGHPLTVPRVREYAEFMLTLSRLLDLMAAESFRRVVTMDANWRESWSGDEVWSPYALFASQRMEWASDGLDVIAWDRSFDMAGREVIPAGRVTGSNHPFIFVTLK